MIPQFEGFAAKEQEEYVNLPVGGYVAIIKHAEIVTFRSNDLGLKLSFDIAEGEYKDYYKNAYNNTKKWLGNYVLFVPNKNSQYFETQKKAFNHFIFCLESSNSYKFDWDESKMENLFFGAIMREEEYEKGGKIKSIVKPYKVKTVEQIRKMDFDVPEPKRIQPATTATPTPTFAYDSTDLPF